MGTPVKLVRTISFLLAFIVLAPLAHGQAALEAQSNADPAARVASDLVGTWSADFDKMLSTMEMTSEERQRAHTFLDGAEMVLRFNADGTLTMDDAMMGQQQHHVGTWVLLGTADQTITITATSQEEEGGTPETEEMTVVFYDDNAISISDAEGGEIPFNRQGTMLVDDVAASVSATSTSATTTEPAGAVSDLWWPEPDGTEASFELLEGTWSAQFDLMLSVQELSAEEFAAASEFLADAQMNLTFHAEGGLEMNGEFRGTVQHEEGTWVEDSTDGVILTITTGISGEDGGPEVDVMTVEFITEDHIQIADPDGEMVPFLRVAP